MRIAPNAKCQRVLVGYTHSTAGLIIVDFDYNTGQGWMRDLGKCSSLSLEIVPQSAGLYYGSFFTATRYNAIRYNHSMYYYYIDCFLPPPKKEYKVGL